jgi:hypothetical protein
MVTLGHLSSLSAKGIAGFDLTAVEIPLYPPLRKGGRGDLQVRRFFQRRTTIAPMPSATKEKD